MEQKEVNRILTGKELRVAAKKSLPVMYEEKFFNPSDKHKDYFSITVMEKATQGYYIGNSDIEPDDYKNNQLVQGEFLEGTFCVRAVTNIQYI